ncbi:unnamed protein product [Camellia sinensis]
MSCCELITIQHLPIARSSFVSIPPPRSIWKADKLPYMARKWRRVLPRASIDCTPSCLRKLQRSVYDSDDLQSDAASLKAWERLMMGGGAVKLVDEVAIFERTCDNVESTHLEESTWMDSNSCHVMMLGTDPQKSIPCITAIGYSGLQLWQNEGFVSADILASSLEKAWLSLHIQETTRTFLTAALASKKSEPQGTSGSDTASFEQGSSSVDVPSPSTDKHALHSEARAAASTEMENKESDQTDEEINSKLGDEASIGSVLGEVGRSISSIETAKESINPVKVDPNDAGVGHTSSVARDECPAQEGKLNVVDHHSEVTSETSQVIANAATDAVQDKEAEAVEDDKIKSEVTTETCQVIANKATEAVQDKKADDVEEDKIDVLDSCSSKSTDVHLNIRLLDGANLQEKFLLTSTLRMVRGYVDENQASSIGSYDLAIPYPR